MPVLTETHVTSVFADLCCLLFLFVDDSSVPSVMYGDSLKVISLPATLLPTPFMAAKALTISIFILSLDE